MALMEVNFFLKSTDASGNNERDSAADKVFFEEETEADNKPFKTLYLLHGVMGNYTDWVTGTCIKRWAEEKNLAVVGLNGAGKTTLIKIICGFLDPTKGQVKLNGTDIRNYNRKDYYKLFSAVFQDFSLLAGTIAENVAQTENSDPKQVKKLYQKKPACFPKIEALPD